MPKFTVEILDENEKIIRRIYTGYDDHTAYSKATTYCTTLNDTESIIGYQGKNKNNLIFVLTRFSNPTNNDMAGFK